MALCPLLKSECIQEKCEWWHETELRKHTGCSIVSLPDRLVDIYNRLDDMNYRLDCAFGEININGERLIENYRDEMKDIPKKE
jgi:hypothetical protein